MYVRTHKDPTSNLTPNPPVEPPSASMSLSTSTGVSAATPLRRRRSSLDQIRHRAQSLFQLPQEEQMEPLKSSADWKQKRRRRLSRALSFSSGSPTDVVDEVEKAAVLGALDTVYVTLIEASKMGQRSEEDLRQRRKKFVALQSSRSDSTEEAGESFPLSNNTDDSVRELPLSLSVFFHTYSYTLSLAQWVGRRG